MPWKETTKMDERKRFISRLHAGEKMTSLCREYGISRTTGYKFKTRYGRCGEPGLLDQPRGPRNPRNRVSEEMQGHILQLKGRYKDFGAKKLRALLLAAHPGVRIPARSTIDSVLSRHGLTERRNRRSVVSVYPHGLSQSTEPNQVWCADFKGQFRLGNGRWCYPLTVTDHFSRKILACEAFECIDLADVVHAFEMLFSKYGLPEAIRTDNGSPFASRAFGGLSRLSVWWISLGIIPERIKRGCL